MLQGTVEAQHSSSKPFPGLVRLPPSPLLGEVPCSTSLWQEREGSQSCSSLSQFPWWPCPAVTLKNICELVVAVLVPCLPHSSFHSLCGITGIQAHLSWVNLAPPHLQWSQSGLLRLEEPTPTQPQSNTDRSSAGVRGSWPEGRMAEASCPAPELPVC